MSVSMGGMIQTRGTPKYSERNVSQCHFLATNPSWTGLGLNPDLCREGVCMSQGTAIMGTNVE